ncbi:MULTISPECIES: siderophore-interacting protein [Pseudomonas]|uniref:NADPH-dependent ferric siderophore reductase n=1 Tax=Pseudomonas hunanensis TaxID=1247546 RepID=A0ACC6K8E0_9PSED|nr:MULTISPECIES: siderophore-interacting protein [Pseudomonas]MBP2263410.1 NADPH-dependent ferric siderophore reductase [Pseudomonas sp. BP8]MDR6714750.1 NADPH-dependent ferric siderophore reductase [Pseudomonas hunanensis]HDS1736020.1 siderophore-interacting protein [Pseudomonas putida]
MTSFLTSLIRRNTASAYRIFDIQLKAIEPLSPSLRRYVFTGEDVRHMNTLAADQRIKLFFPSPSGQLPSLPKDGKWQQARRGLPAEHTPPMRTYTIRQLDREAREVAVDFVLHGVNGPASAWATHARLGDRLQMVAPNLDYAGDPGGYEWKPPQGVKQVLLIGDETALPAIAGILEGLTLSQPELPAEVFVEVPLQSDCLQLLHSAATTVHWLPRDLLRCEHGHAMRHAVRELAQLPSMRVCKQPDLHDVDIEQSILWERASGDPSEFYAWVAGESATVMEIRRYLLKERGLDRDSVTLMGYWRAGRSFE